MCFHWPLDRESREQFRIYWRPGKLNYADYWTKHHAGTHHRNVRNVFDTVYCSRDATTGAIGSSSCSSIRALMREHLRGCDDLAVYGTRLDPMQTCKPQTSSRYTAQTEYQAPLICARPRYPQDRIPIILDVSLPYEYSGTHHDTTGSLVCTVVIIFIVVVTIFFSFPLSGM